MLEMKNVSKAYQETVLNHVNMTFENHGLYMITGESGSGKSTLLHILGGLDDDYSGDICYNGISIQETPHYLQNHVGFVFQDFHLIEAMTIASNIQMPRFFKMFVKDWKKQSEELGISQFKKKTSILSRGQKQRVAMLRAMLGENDIILLDEPTGSLDAKNARQIFELLHSYAKEKLVIVVSHDYKLALEYGDEVYEMQNHQPVCIHTKPKETKAYGEHQYQKHSFMQFVLLYCRTYMKNHLFLLQGVTLTLLCLMLSFSLTQSLKDELLQSLESIMPTSVMMVQKKNKQNISVNDLQELSDEGILHRFLDFEDVELLGLSSKTNYQESESFYFHDYIQKITPLEKGKMPTQDSEVVVSLSTYQHLLKTLNKKTLLNKSVYLHFKHHDQIKACKVKITGVTKQKTAVDTLYFQEYAYANICHKLFKKESGDLGFIQVQELSEEALGAKYPAYTFQIANASMRANVDKTFSQLTVLLVGCASLAVVSSVFLLVVVFELDVIKKRRFFALLKTMGATEYEITALILLQGISICVLAFMEALLLSSRLFDVLGALLKQLLLIDIVITFDMKMLVILSAMMVVVAILSLLLPSYRASKVNVIKTLQKY